MEAFSQYLEDTLSFLSPNFLDVFFFLLAIRRCRPPFLGEALLNCILRLIDAPFCRFLIFLFVRG